MTRADAARVGRKDIAEHRRIDVTEVGCHHEIALVLVTSRERLRLVAVHAARTALAFMTTRRPNQLQIITTRRCA